MTQPRRNPSFLRRYPTWLVLLVLLTTAIVLVQWRVRSMRVAEIRFRAIGMRIDVNHAEAPTLHLLPGIGPSLAQRIVDHRQTHGPFQSTAELRNVPGIGEQTLKRIEPYITLDHPPQP